MPIEIRDIKKSYGEKVVLNGVNAVIPDSGIFGIFGPSGCGKTTLLRIICSLETPDSGKISGLEGKRLSVVFQEDRLMPTFTALQNVSAVSNEEIAREMLRRVELSEAAEKLPSQLSGGMSRRVALARAFAYEGDVLVLDEPLKGLEPELRGRMASLICEYSQNHTVILVTHDETERELANNYLNLMQE